MIAMSKASPVAPVSEPQYPLATPIATRNDRPATLAAAITEKVENIRLLLHTEALPGTGGIVARWMGWRRERISRELQGVEKLSLALFLASVEVHRSEGRGAAADRLLAALNSGQPVKLRTDRAVVIRMSDGQLFLDLQ